MVHKGNYYLMSCLLLVYLTVIIGVCIGKCYDLLVSSRLLVFISLHIWKARGGEATVSLFSYRQCRQRVRSN